MVRYATNIADRLNLVGREVEICLIVVFFVLQHIYNNLSQWIYLSIYLSLFIYLYLSLFISMPVNISVYCHVNMSITVIYACLNFFTPISIKLLISICCLSRLIPVYLSTYLFIYITLSFYLCMSIILDHWRCPWCNGYRRRKWTRRHEFKSWTRLIEFHIALIPLGKVWIQLFSLQLWVNSRADWVLQPWWGN